MLYICNILQVLVCLLHWLLKLECLVDKNAHDDQFSQQIIISTPQKILSKNEFSFL